MLARVGNSVYWLGRYLERVENYARFLGANINLSFDLGEDINKQLKRLTSATFDNVLFDNLYETDTEEVLLHFIVFDYLNPNSIYNTLRNARENAKTVREVFPREFWEGINVFYLEFVVFKDSGKTDLSELLAFFEWLKQQCQFLTGMLDATLSRTEAFYFFTLGRFVERADKTSRSLDLLYFNLYDKEDPFVLDISLGSAILKSASAFNMYRQVHKDVRYELMLEFLIKDRYFPRSLFFCVWKIKEFVLNLGAKPHGELLKKNEQVLKQFTDMDMSVFDLSDLHHFVNDFQIFNNDLDKMIFDLYFNLS